MNKLSILVTATVAIVVTIFAIAVWTLDGGKAQTRCPATSKATCDGLILKKLGV